MRAEPPESVPACSPHPFRTRTKKKSMVAGVEVSVADLSALSESRQVGALKSGVALRSRLVEQQRLANESLR